ncbi:hypothetical protein KCP73_12045 [Salmonella enterica subsp. enterica]|nr:hypothetical protein KCP73_12045 [Salmonella enterica subsp. enterica]
MLSANNEEHEAGALPANWMPITCEQAPRQRISLFCIVESSVAYLKIPHAEPYSVQKFPAAPAFLPSGD